jgi:hypothetical protein
VGFYFVEPNLLQGEEIRRRYAANRASTWKSVGGQLLVTNLRIIFQPHRVDALFHAQPWSGRLRDVASVDVAAKKLSAKEMGVRNRLQITLQDGHQEKFLVRDLDQVVAELRAQPNTPTE